MLKAKNKLGLVLFPAFDWAISETHPEREERLLYTKDQLLEEGIGDIPGIHFYNPVLAEEKDILRVHFPYPDVKTIVTNPHLIAAGGAIRAGEAVMKGEVDKSFALVRPPGHHAFRATYGDRGFCIINVEAVMVEHLRQKFGDMRVAVIDTDCHHGDGTQDIFWNDKDTLFISFHQDGRTLYPGTGFIEEFGGPSAVGYNLNIPLAPGTGEEGFLYVLENVVLPVLEDFKPDLIINSAGQDNHYTDPLTNMNFTAQGYAKLNEKLNPDIAVLEGGYSIEGALPYVNLGIILAMAGLDYSHVKEPDYDPERLRQPDDITEYTKRISEEVLKLWKNRLAIERKLYAGKDIVEKPQRIYYDTLGLTEYQMQHFHLCKKCPGINTIKSSNDWGDSLFAVSIPRKACPSCVDKGHKLYRETPQGKHGKIYLQDKTNDHYESK